MRIALLTDGIYPYVVGGMQKHAYNLAKYFSQHKIYVDLYHTIAPSSTYDINALLVFTENEKKFINSIVVHFPTKGYYPGHYLRESFQYSKAIYAELSNRPLPDFIYAQGYSAWDCIRQKKRGVALPPIAVNFHGLEMYQPTVSLKAKLQQFLLRNAAKYNVTQADYVINYGGKIGELLIKIGSKPQQFIISPNATEESWLEKDATAFNTPLKFLFIGRYERRKGVQELTTVLKDLLSDNTVKFEFHFIGPIPENVKIIHPFIIYHGSVLEFKAIKKIILSTDVLVCPSLAEGMPTVILEAMASGLAIIATDTGGNQSWVSDKTGWLIKPASVSELKQALLAALKISSQELQLRKRNAIELVKTKYLWDNVIQESIEDIKKVIALQKKV